MELRLLRYVLRDGTIRNELERFYLKIGGGDVNKCEYCNPANAKPLIYECALYVFIEKKLLVAGYSDMCTFESIESTQINYCPMCGRKLSDK